MTNKRDISHFGLIDWDFKSEDSKSFIHNFCWYPSRFIPIIPSHLIQSLSHKNDVVLDPYCGSGTTLLESIKLGRNAIGIDLNPIAAFIANTKVSVLQHKSINIEELNYVLSELDKVNHLIDHNDELSLFSGKSVTSLDTVDVNLIPNFSDNSQWYHPLTLRMLAYIFTSIRSVTDIHTRDLLVLFFISILIPSTGHENKKPYTYYADNVKPKKLIYKNAIYNYVIKLKKFIVEYTKNDTQYSNYGIIINSDIRNLKQSLETHKPVDLIITSPPYLSVTDYTTGYRLVYLWDIFEADMNAVKRLEIGARWKRKVTASQNNYIKAIQSSLLDMSAVLKKSGYLCLILGEAKKHREIIINELKDFATSKAELSLKDVYSRNLSKNFFINPQGGVATEDILIFQRG